MLQSLHVHNFALIEDARAEFTTGFNVFTGETGAGKSILIDAFSIVLGGRASSDQVRHGTETMWVQAVFNIKALPKVKGFLLDQGLDPEEDLFLKRQVTAAGKSRAFINGVQVPLAVLKQLGTLLVDIHGQHENQALLKPEAPRLITDSFGGSSLREWLGHYKQVYSYYQELLQRLAGLRLACEQQDLLLDRYSWEIKEISEAHLLLEEEEELLAEARALTHKEKLVGTATMVHGVLDSDRGVLSQLASVRDSLQGALRYDKRLQGIYEGLDGSWITLDDCRTELAAYLSSSEFDSGRAEAVQERLDLYNRLKKKYGGTVEDVLNYLQEAQKKYQELEEIAATLAEAEAEVGKVEQQLNKIAATLHKLRCESAKDLAERITQHIHDLAMAEGVFAIEVQSLPNFLPHGKDQLTFKFSANVGEPLSLLEKVASGGELSRIALALKTVLMNSGAVPTMVFDEIDTGVGGRTAGKMAEKIAAIATVGQVLCITHLPQIAAFADNHLLINKHSLEGRTKTELQLLAAEDRAKELMRMAGAEANSRPALASAKELIRTAAVFKKGLNK